MKIALISDIHFGSGATHNDMVIPGQKSEDHYANSKPFFEGDGGVLDILKNEKPDYLFISGDLTSTADPLEYEYCYEKLKLIEDIAGINKSNWLVCLGNHDCDWRISKLGAFRGRETPKKRFIKEHYMDTRTNDLETHKLVKELSENFSNEYEGFSVPMVGVVEYDDLIVFVLHSGIECTNDNNYGSIGNNQLEWLTNALKFFNEKREKKTKIILLHHHPHNYEYPIPDADRSALVEGATLKALCGEQGVDIIIHGHRHHPRAETIVQNGWLNPITFICSGSLSVIQKERLGGEIPSMFHIMDCTDINKIILETYTYNLIDGWDRKSTRDIDDVIWLGKSIMFQDVESIIAAMPCDGQEIEHVGLDDSLKYISYKKLNYWIKKVFDEANYQITDEFPHSIRIRYKADLEAK